jgi:hypothetical protein
MTEIRKLTSLGRKDESKRYLTSLGRSRPDREAFLRLKRILHQGGTGKTMMGKSDTAALLFL